MAFQQLAPQQSYAEVPVNDNNTALGQAFVFSRNVLTTTGLTQGFNGGNFNVTTVADGTIALTASTTNYLVVHRATLVVSTSTATTNWNDSTTYGRMARGVTSASAITSYTDERYSPGGIFASAATGNALTTNPLSQFAATTSAQLAGVLSDETGTGALVFGTSPTLVTPALGTPSALVLTNATGLPGSQVTGAYTAAGLTLATARMLGRTTGATGAAEEISIGSGLSLSAGTLTATGGGGTVTSVALTVPAHLSITGSPITGAGTLAIGLSGTALPVANGGTGVTTSTGSGNNVLSTSPTFVTPILGTPTSGTLTNCTGLPVAGGGTGVATLTAYAPIFGGTTGTGAVQSGTAGTSGQVLTSNGAGVLPTFQAGGSAYSNAYDVRAFGTIVGNGTTDDSATFAAAAASGARVIHAENLNCAILSQISIPANQIWVLSGSKLTMTSTTTAMWRANLVDDWALIGPFTIVGAGSTVGTAKGVYVTGCNRWKVDHYTARTINGWGVYIEDGVESGTLRGDQGYMHNFRAESCYVGYEDTAGSAGEYTTLIAPYITGCGTGLRMAAGNTLVMGGHVVDNTGNGLELKNGANHGHGAFVGTNFNHNTTYNIFADQVTNGHDFIGCHIYGTPGTINLDRCKGISFVGGHLDCAVAAVSGASSGRNIIRDMYCPGTSIAVSGTGATELTFLDCFGSGADDGATPSIPINDPATVYVHVERAASSTQSITAATATTLTFSTENFDRCAAYNLSTGVFTVPTGETGNYRFMGNIMIAGTSLTNSSYIDFQANSLSSHLLTGAPYQADRLIFNFCFDRYLQATDTVRLQATIGGSAITHGGSSWKSTMSIERIQ